MSDLPRKIRGGRRCVRCADGTGSPPPAAARRSTAKMSMSSPAAAAIFCRSSISSTVESRSRSEAASSKRVSSDACSHSLAQLAGQIRHAGLPETAGRRAPRSHSSRRSSGPPRKVPGSDECGTAGTACGWNRVRSTLQDGTRKCRWIKLHQPMRQIARKVRTEVSGAVFAQPPRHVHARIFFAGQLDVRIGLVVAQQDIEARLPLLDEIVLERQRLFLVVDQDVIDVARLPTAACRS